MKRLFAAGMIVHDKPLVEVKLIAEHADGERVAYASSIDVEDHRSEVVYETMRELEEQASGRQGHAQTPR